jgi:hypothetical protein
MNNRSLVAVLATGVLCWGQTATPVEVPGFGFKKTPLVVKLVSPITTKTNKVGDAFTATVEDARFPGAIIEGRITKLVKPEAGVGKEKPQVEFQFDKFTFNNQTAKVLTDVKGVSNSKGVKNVDEEGVAVGYTSNAKRILGGALGSGVGALIGSRIAGGVGAAAGAAVGGAAGLAIAVTMTTTGKDIDFQPGSQFTLEVSDGKKP